MIIETLIYVIIFLILLSAAWAGYSAAPWLPTRSRDVKRMIILAGIKPGDKVYDLGCGDGRLVFAAAKAGAQAKGVDIFVIPYLVAKVRSWFVKNSKIIWGDLFKINLADADVIYIFLLDKSYPRLIKKFAKELKPGAKVVVHCWPIKEWENKLIKEDKPKDELAIYIYKN